MNANVDLVANEMAMQIANLSKEKAIFLRISNSTHGGGKSAS